MTDEEVEAAFNYSREYYKGYAEGFAITMVIAGVCYAGTKGIKKLNELRRNKKKLNAKFE